MASIPFARGLAMLALVAAAFVPAGISTGSNNGNPTFVEGPTNHTCSDFAPDGTTYSELKVDPPRDGTYSDGTLTVTVNVDGSTKTFDWTSDLGVSAVFVKAGRAGSNLYTYDPSATSGDDLTSPGHGTTNQISHISFCYIAPPDCTADPSAPGCEEEPTCEDNPTLPGCEEEPTCEDDPTLPGCEEEPSCSADLNAVVNGNGTITVHVDVDGPEAYDLQRDDGSGDWVTLGSFDDDTTYLDSDTDANATYTYRAFMGGEGCGDVTVTTPQDEEEPTCEDDPTLPGCEEEPTCEDDPTLPGCEEEPGCVADLTASANDDGTVSVHVDVDGDAAFDLQRKEGPGGFELLGSFQGDTDYLDSDTVPETTYTYRAFMGGEGCGNVTATTPGDEPTCEDDPTLPGCEEEPTCEDDPTLPGCEEEPPCVADLTASANDNGSVSVHVDVEDTQAFDLQRKEGAGGFEVLGSFEGDTDYLDSDTAPETTYTYRAFMGGEGCGNVTVTTPAEEPTCETDPTLPGCEEEPTCEDDPTLPGCEEEPTCEDDPTMPGCNEDPDCTAELTATPHENETLTVHVTAAEPYDLQRQVNGGDWVTLASYTGDATHHDTDTSAGTTYVYRAFMGGMGCGEAIATAIPVFGTTLGIGLATAGGLAALVLAGWRRKQA